jgi:uncharacterized protein YaiI (UPF0178 family)
MTESRVIRMPPAAMHPAAYLAGGEMDGKGPRNRKADVKLWIDADAAPRDVKEIVYRAARRLQLATVLVANQRLPVPPGNPFVSTVRVEGGPDVADRHIADGAEPGDVAVTADIPLAAALVQKSVFVIDPRGDEYTPDSIGERLAVRDFMDGLRGAGVETGGARPYGEREKKAFAAALDRVLTRAMRGGLPGR